MTEAVWPGAGIRFHLPSAAALRSSAICHLVVEGAGRPEMAEPLKVLHCVAGNLYGGVETFLTTLAETRGL